LDESLPKNANEIVPLSPLEHEPERELLGQCLYRIIFQKTKTGTGNGDSKHSTGEVRQAIFMYVEVDYNRIRIHSDT
jgi:hypothetical protein